MWRRCQAAINVRGGKSCWWHVNYNFELFLWKLSENVHYCFKLRKLVANLFKMMLANYSFNLLLSMFCYNKYKLSYKHVTFLFLPSIFTPVVNKLCIKTHIYVLLLLKSKKPFKTVVHLKQSRKEKTIRRNQSKLSSRKQKFTIEKKII